MLGITVRCSECKYGMVDKAKIGDHGWKLVLEDVILKIMKLNQVYDCFHKDSGSNMESCG